MREQFDEIHCETKARGFALPISVEQQRLRPPDQFEGPGPAHNLLVYLQMQGNLDRTVLASSLKCLLERHPVLRFGICQQHAELFLRYSKRTTLRLEAEDLTYLPEEDAREKYRELDKAVLQQPFNLQKRSLVKILPVRSTVCAPPRN